MKPAREVPTNTIPQGNFNPSTTLSTSPHPPTPEPISETYSTTYCLSVGRGGCVGVESSIFQMISEQSSMVRNSMLITCVSGTLTVGEKAKHDIYPFFFRTPISITQLREEGLWSRQLHDELSGCLNPALLPCSITRKAALAVLSENDVTDPSATIKQKHSILWNLSVRVTIFESTIPHFSKQLHPHQSSTSSPITAEPAVEVQYTTYEEQSEDSSASLDFNKLFGSSTSDDNGEIDEVD